MSSRLKDALIALPERIRRLGFPLLGTILFFIPIGQIAQRPGIGMTERIVALTCAAFGVVFAFILGRASR
jgi:hypothetical protein